MVTSKVRSPSGSSVKYRNTKEGLPSNSMRHYSASKYIISIDFMRKEAPDALLN